MAKQVNLCKLQDITNAKQHIIYSTTIYSIIIYYNKFLFGDVYPFREHTRIVPFRESRLTRIFQSFFCGKGRASMIVNINQVASLFDETLHALKYSAIAKEVRVVSLR